MFIWSGDTEPNTCVPARCLQNTVQTKGPDGLTKNDLSIDINNTAAILTLIFQYSLDSGTLPGI